VIIYGSFGLMPCQPPPPYDPLWIPTFGLLISDLRILFLTPVLLGVPPAWLRSHRPALPPSRGQLFVDQSRAMRHRALIFTAAGRMGRRSALGAPQYRGLNEPTGGSACAQAKVCCSLCAI